MGPKTTIHLLKQLRGLMQNIKYVPEPITAYIVPSRDAHNNEYLAECDQFRGFITGFDGSAGTAIITGEDACLWTDGRYYLQASEQMDSCWTLMKEGLPTTPTKGEWLSKNLPRGSKIGFDPKIFTYNEYNPLQTKLESSGHKLVPVNINLIEVLWVNRPPRPTNSIRPHSLKYSGKSVGDKLRDVVLQMKENNAQYLVLTALDEIAWFLNLRGSDIEYNPVFFSYVIISEKSFELYLDEKQDSKLIREHLTSEFGEGYKIKTYSSIEDRLKTLASEVEGYIWFAESCSYALTSLVPREHCFLTINTPVSLMKAVKNPVEIQGMRNCHIRDAAALCCYFSWLEKNIKTTRITEMSGSKKLLEFRKMQDDFVGPSFDTISSVGPHGAIIHYSPKESTDVQITADQMYLCDSGGQYLDGTTDVTRTLHFGEATVFEKECYTRVLKGQMKLASQIFPTKIKGNCLDAFAREFLWQVGLDYAHGTSHGIGSYLNVHEGPMGISWRPMADDPGLEAGMFLSNEPGYYQDGKFGIRIEDIVQIVQAMPPHNFNDRGYLTFDTVCLVPKMNKLILVDMLTDEEIQSLNEYHDRCRKLVGDLLEKQGQVEAREWLIRETEPLMR